METNIDVGLGEGVFTNIAGYRKFRSSAGADIDGTPQSFFHAFFEIDQDQLSDELRYAGRFGDVELTTGLYYFS